MINPNDITTVRVDQLPPDTMLLTDILPFETLDDQTLKKATFQDLINFININASALQHEIKELFVNQEYIDNNIDEDGFGINLLTGWRLATELDGLVTIGYGAVNSNIGGYGGEKQHILTLPEIPPHTHENSGSANDNGDPGQFVITSPNNGGENVSVVSTSKGGGLAHNNMQPYCVVLKIIKL